MRLRAPSLAVAVAAVVALAGPASASDPGDYGTIAHRGYTITSTENSLKAVTTAAESGATAAEVDIRLTADRAMIVMHDRSLLRTTNCGGKVHARTLASIRNNCRLNDGSRIPTAASMLRHANTESLSLLLEIKRDPLDRWTPERFMRLAELAAQAGMQDRTMLLSFSELLMNMARASVPGWDTVWIATEPTTVVEAQANGDHLAIDTTDLTPGLVEQAQAVGMRVYGLVSDDPDEWRVYDEQGFDGVLVDLLREYVAVYGTTT